MTIQDFRVASFEKKCDWIINNTNYLASREDKTGKIFLYHTGQFFIEVCYTIQDKRVAFIQEFNDTEKLMPYLEDLTTESLLA